MPLIVPDAVRVSILGTQADGPWAMVTGWDMSGTSGEENALTTAQAVIDAFVVELLPHLTDSVTVTRATYVDLRAADGDTGEVLPSTGDPTSGGVHVDASPPQVTYLVKLLTTGGRSLRSGRSFVPGVRSDEVNERGDVASGTVTTMNTAYNAFMATATSGSSAVLGVIHRPSSGSDSITPVTSAICEPTVATQRRRLRR